MTAIYYWNKSPANIEIWSMGSEPMIYRFNSACYEKELWVWKTQYAKNSLNLTNLK